MYTITESCGIKDTFDGLPKAREASVFILVALNSYWKVAYILINVLSSQEKANLVNTTSFLYSRYKNLCENFDV